MISIELILKARGQGKTHDLILESAKTGIPILTFHDSRYIVQQAMDMGVKIHQPMTINEYEYFRRNGSLKKGKIWDGRLLIDEVDSVLSRLLDAKIEIATCTPNSFEERENNKMIRESLFCSSNDRVNVHSERKFCLPSGLELIIENDKDFKIKVNEITDVNIIVPNKVVEVTFADGTKEKSVCREPDVFSLEQAISICISKKIMGGSGAYNNAVKRSMKVYEDKLKKEKADKAEQERIAKKRAKRLAYKERRTAERAKQEEEKKQLEREEKIEIQKEAYIRAIKTIQNESDDKTFLRDTLFN